MAVAALGAFFVVRGRLNADEGWYLYSSRLVYRGELPFRDFSFTQMPLLPYLYGLVQLVKPSLYLGRLVSLVLLTGAVAMSVRVAWREAGRAAAVAVGLLVLLAPTAVYNLTLTKTYALVAFFLAALLLTLTSPGRRTLMFPLAAAAAVGLALSRSSGLPLAAIVLVYLLWRAPDRRTRVWVAGIERGRRPRRGRLRPRRRPRRALRPEHVPPVAVARRRHRHPPRHHRDHPDPRLVR